MSSPNAMPPEERALRDELARSRAACIRSAEKTASTAERATRVLDEARAKRTAERRAIHDEATCTDPCCAPKKEQKS